MIKYQKTVLDNGLRIVTETHPLSRSFSCGAWVIRGTRDEPEGQQGISHFIEHLVFKGTRKRSAFEIAASLETLGGDLNAYTTKEHTCYHGLVLRDHFDRAIDVVCDLVTNMRIKKKDFELEKNVILQEMSMSYENHEEIIFEEFFERIYRKHPLGRRILGTEKSIRDITLKNIESYYLETYRPENTVISASGNLKHSEVVRRVEKATRTWKKRSPFTSVRASVKKNAQPSTVIPRTAPAWTTVRDCINQKSEQIHLLLGFPVPSFKDQRRFESFVLNAYLGGGMTSSLFQNVREKKGLVYNIQSTLNTHEDCGCILIYASTERNNVKTVTETIFKELRNIRQNGIKKEFVQQFKTQVAGQILLGSDDMENRMSSLGINEMVFEEYRPVEDVISDVKKVTSKSIKTFLDDQMDFSQVSGLLLGSNAKEFEGWWKNVFVKNEN